MAYKTGKLLPTNELLDMFDPEISYDEENEIFKYAESSEKGHCICIKFDKMFDRPDIRQHNIFKIHYRRYYKFIQIIADDLNIILNSDNDAARMLVKFNMRMALNDKKPYSEEEFFNDVIDFINEIKDDIKNHVENNYELNLNSNTDKINKDLQITDEMNKIFIESAIGMRVCLPIICVYTQDNPIENIFYKIFRIVTKIFGGEEFKPLTKLTRIIKSRIWQTKYSNKKIWNFLRNQSKDMELLSLDFYIYLIESIIPKLMENHSSIQYLDVVLRNKIEYAFTFNYNIDFKPVKKLDNDDDSDERDRLNEMLFVSRKDEAQLVLNKLTIEDYIKNFIDEYGIEEKDINDFREENLHNKNINEIQNYFLLLCYGREFEMSVTTEKDRLLLLYKLIIDLQENGFVEIPKMLASSVSDNIVSYGRTRVSSKLKNQRIYLKILNKWGDVIDVIEKDNFIFKILDFKNIIFIDEDGNNIEFDSNKYEREVFQFLLSL